MGSTRAARRARSPLAVTGVVLVILALAAAALLAWRFWAGPLLTRQTIADEITAVRASWETPATAGPQETDARQPPVVMEPGPHDASWLLRIPTLEQEWPIIAGVEPDDLDRGVGWYPGSALPGQVGNFALAGHCIDAAAPFRGLGEVALGDEIVVETREATFTYELVSPPGNLTVSASDRWVIDPVPGETDVLPTQALLTLTTCEDLIPTEDRAVGFGTLIKTEKK